MIDQIALTYARLVCAVPTPDVVPEALRPPKPMTVAEHYAWLLHRVHSADAVPPPAAVGSAVSAVDAGTLVR